MARPTLASRSRTALGSASSVFEPRAVRVTSLTIGLVATLGLHLLLADPRIAWGSVPLVLLAGLAGGRRSPLTFALLAVAGHLVVDVLIGVTLAELIGLVLRSAILPGVALVGMAGRQVEVQRGQAMHRSVTEDPVTGLLNVRAFYDELRALREAERPFAILLADIRGMRALNERYGHPTGTEAMRALAQVLRREAGTDVLASRLGSDEVAIALVGEDRDRTSSIVEGIIGRLHDEQVPLPDGERFEVHAAYGLARFPEDGDDEVGVLRAADRAKERAKVAGMDKVGTADGHVG